MWCGSHGVQSLLYHPLPSVAACNVKSLSIRWQREQLEAGLCEDYLDYWLSPPKSPHPLLKGTNPSFAPRFAPLCSPLSSMIPPHPKFLQSLPFQDSPISHKYSWNGAGLREQTSTAPPWVKHNFWMVPSIFSHWGMRVLSWKEYTYFQFYIKQACCVT